MTCAFSLELLLQQHEVQVAACHYYEQEKHLAATSADFADWVQGLPITQQIICQAAGFEAAKCNISFRRYLLERCGFSLYDHMNAHLSSAATQYWRCGCNVWGCALDPNI